MKNNMFWYEKKMSCPQNEHALTALLESKKILEPVDYSQEPIVLKFKGFDIDEQYVTIHVPPTVDRNTRQEYVFCRLCEVEAALEISGEELKCHCNALGINEKWLAKIMNVTPEDVALWMDGQKPIPVNAALWVIQSFNFCDLLSTPDVDMDSFDSVYYLIKFRNIVELWQYLPDMATFKISLAMHETMLERTKSFITSLTDGTTKIVYFDSQNYELWRKDREHSQKLMQEWAGHFCRRQNSPTACDG